MRLDINLASQPYEDARQFWMRWGTAAGALGLLTLILLALDISGWFAARRDRITMAQQRSAIAERDKIRADAERVLNLPENRATRDESQFLNQLIVRKAFSWTRVLENLEKVMPPGVHVVSISPQLDEDNDLLLKMTVAGNSRDRALELAQRMEESRRFAQTNVIRIQRVESQTGDTAVVELGATYVPELSSDGASTSASATASQAPTDGKPKTPPNKTPVNKTPGSKAPANRAPATRGSKH